MPPNRRLNQTLTTQRAPSPFIRSTAPLVALRALGSKLFLLLFQFIAQQLDFVRMNLDAQVPTKWLFALSRNKGEALDSMETRFMILFFWQIECFEDCKRVKFAKFFDAQWEHAIQAITLQAIKAIQARIIMLKGPSK